ncbi:MAG: undecaprenyl-phosphate galactose phosphotransferase WbaP [Bryobacteraceae bacterium]|nr:undecaprenyl-phosphate galactose phosphotransferase WbaP [Bryobacteraceae bacterium]
MSAFTVRTAAVSQPSFPARPAIRPSLIVAAGFMAVDLCALATACLGAVLVRYAIRTDYELSFYLSMAPVLLLFLAAYALSGLYPGVALSPVLELELLCKTTTATFLLLIAVSFFLRDVEAYSRVALLLAWGLGVPAVIVGRLAARRFFGNRSWWGVPVVLMGRIEDCEAVVAQLHRHKGLGLKAIRVLTDSYPSENSVHGVPVHHDYSLAGSFAERSGIEYCVLAMPRLRGDALMEFFERYAARFRNVVVIPDLFGLASLGTQTRDFGGILGIEIRQRLLLRVPRAAKRLTDLALCGASIVLLAPLLGVLWLAVRLSSHGPAFYSHTRIGQDGRMFAMLKFRTMYSNGKEILDRHLAEDPEAAGEWERERKLRHDPRVTPVGRFLRRTSLDELPQLWNVLRGDMSLIGPRPIPESELPRYPGHLYFRVSPGLTGLWQVSGRNNTSYAERVFFDEYYVRNWSIWLDLHILMRTIRVVLTGEGAY